MSFGSFFFFSVLIRFVFREGFLILLSFTLLIKSLLFLIKTKKSGRVILPCLCYFKVAYK